MISLSAYDKNCLITDYTNERGFDLYLLPIFMVLNTTTMAIHVTNESH